MALNLTSAAFGNDERIPSTYTCEGKDISPPLEWSGVPAGAKSLVLIADDPDAPDPAAPQMTWVHWVIFNMPARDGGLPEGAGAADLPEGAAEGMNDFGRTPWGGPCPPIGRHRYYFKLYALDRKLDLAGHPDKGMVEDAMTGHVLDQSVLVGTYRKGD